MSAIVYKICDEAEWKAAVAAGHYGGSSDDIRDGFIHFSTAAQLRATAAKHFAGRSSLVLVAIEAAPLGAALKWETSRGGQLFPHLYGVLATDAVLWVRVLPLGADAGHIFPAEVVT